VDGSPLTFIKAVFLLHSCKPGHLGYLLLLLSIDLVKSLKEACKGSTKEAKDDDAQEHHQNHEASFFGVRGVNIAITHCGDGLDDKVQRQDVLAKAIVLCQVFAIILKTLEFLIKPVLLIHLSEAEKCAGAQMDKNDNEADEEASSLHAGCHLFIVTH